jgi:hypothetical protein
MAVLDRKNQAGRCRRRTMTMQHIFMFVALTGVMIVFGATAQAQCNCVEALPPHWDGCFNLTFAECREVNRGGKFYCGWSEGSCPPRFLQRINPGPQCCKQYGRWHCPCPKP